MDGLDFSGFEFDIDIIKGDSVKDKISSIILGDVSIDFNTVISYLFEWLFEGVKNCLPIFSTILCVAILLSLISGFFDDGGVKGSGKICYFVGYIVIISLLLTLFIDILDDTKESVLKMTEQIQVIFPIMIGLMIACNGVKTAGVFSPSVPIICNLLSSLITNVLLPIIVLLFVFSVIGGISEKVKLSKTFDFLKSLFKWIVGLSCVVFCFYIQISGITASTFDGISTKAIKYAIGSSLPLINSVVANGFDIVIASCLLIKNSIGVFGMIIILFIVLKPIIYGGVISLLIKLLSAICQLILPSSIQVMSNISDCVTYLCVINILSGIVYLIILYVGIISLGGLL